MKNIEKQRRNHNRYVSMTPLQNSSQFGEFFPRINYLKVVKYSELYERRFAV